nr:zf-HC2 domain-containing protein [Bacteroidota bacterium]
MMDCNKIQALLIDFVDKNLDIEKTQLVVQHLESCKICHEEVDNLAVLIDKMNSAEDEQPDVAMKLNFEAMLEAEKQYFLKGKKVEMNHEKHKRWLYNPFSQIAAGVALLIAGMLLGLLINNNNQGSESQVAELKSEVNQMKDLLIMTKLEQPMASERIMAANYLEGMSSPDQSVL